MQAQLFHDTIFDAIGADIAAAGGFKIVAGHLWPSESPQTAATKLRNAINPEQAQKLCPQEVMAIKRLAKEQGSFATVNYEAQSLGFQVEWITPEDEKARLQREFIEGTKRLERVLKQIGEVDARPLRAVR
jgi:hypothetical protein